MSSKTFKSATGGDSELDVRANDCGVFIALSRGGQIQQASTFASADAPALALAVLEAAGVAESSDAGVAAQYLRAHVTEQERATAEAKERAELEAEAFELATVYQGYGTWAKELSFSDLDKDAQKNWLAVARRAREMRAEK